MGLSIHYRGTLTDKRAIGRFIDEVEDIAKAMGWPYRILDEDWSRPPDVTLEFSSPGQATLMGDAALKGISFLPHPQSEDVSLFFNASSILTCPLMVAFSAEEGYPARVDWLSVKTQYAGVETHVAIVRLLRYLQGKYLHDLEVHDEGGYWETNDLAMLQTQLDFLGQIIAELGDRLKNLEVSGASQEDIVARIEEVLREMERKRRE
jgi:hypothetical protein